MITKHAIDILEKSLTYDVGFGDLTVETLIPKDLNCKAFVVAKENTKICGMDFVVEFLEKNGISCKKLYDEGDYIDFKDVKYSENSKKRIKILEISGNAQKIITYERTILNFMMHLSAIATKTYEIVSMVEKVNPNVRIACTRKTLPLLSMVEKYAVKVGGGDTHRYRLDDMIMIKDNHIEALGIAECMKRVKKVSFSKKIEVEVDNNTQLREVINHNPDIIMLDNYNDSAIEEALDIINNYHLNGFKPIIELSGGITEKNVLNYAKHPIDVISMGCLIHSAKAVDLGLDLEKI
ncbi:carboxylating nicotinate-nucleotide diphosphorylase [Methanococcus voltae]|uniref:Nicotinate-nucleotide pyrophosphorylase [carboxylating] n=1 Tax=Methanococcus voltae (strain ATCC BAA-1334 / A3) TaxID=456320 RepID=D7DRS1_METV3|nr:carboxylating nicotinate-nucleotide diphosphorylase [Methanococcus voltae]MCS3901149.1 nicotinate-nucleotide pyrophosphorylase (carboxylating) [Methanococcus voltae]